MNPRLLQPTSAVAPSRAFAALEHIGVSAPMRQIAESVHSLLLDVGQPILIGGEPGVGKRWLAERIAQPGEAGRRVLAHVDLLGSATQREIARSFRFPGRHGTPGLLTITDELSRCTGRIDPDLLALVEARSVTLPPVRRRSPEDRRLYILRLMVALSTSIPGAPRLVSDAALGCLLTYAWPGNIREMRSVLERALSLTRDADRLQVGHLPSDLQGLVDDDAAATLAEVERVHIRRVVRRMGGNRTHAARTLGISRATLINKIKTYDLDV